MSDRDKKLLLFLGSFIIIVAAYFFVGRPFLDKLDKVNYEKSELQKELNLKRELAARQDEFIKGIDDANAEMQRIIDRFPEDTSDEKSIMFISKAEKDIPAWFGQVKFADTTENSVRPESASDKEAEAETEAVAANEEGSDGSSARGTDDKTTGVGDLIGRNTELGLKFDTQYDGFKDWLAYLRDYDDRMVVKEMEVEYNRASDLVSGTMTLSQFALLGPGRVLPPVETEVDDRGKDNVFVLNGYQPTMLDLIGEVASDLINAIMGGIDNTLISEEENYFINVTTKTDNMNAKTVGRANDPSGTSYLTSDKNDKEDLTFVLKGSDGQYHAEYEMGGFSVRDDDFNKNKTGHIVLRVISSSRKSDDDKSSLKLHLKNDSDIPLIVNVEGDDAAKPRIEIVDTEGTITVKN